MSAGQGRARWRALLLVGADGVWSTLRGPGGRSGAAAFSGQIAWRTIVRAETRGRAFRKIAPAGVVTAFMHPTVHLIAYPVRGGDAINLVAVTAGEPMGEVWSRAVDPAVLAKAMKGTPPALACGLPEEARRGRPGRCTGSIPASPGSRPGGIALIGDAAHAMTPFAAQGAAMAIEDAETLLAHCVAAGRDDMAKALSAYEAARRPRVARVIRRGAFNHFAWHAGWRRRRWCANCPAAGRSPRAGRRSFLATLVPRGRPRLALRLALASLRRLLLGLARPRRGADRRSWLTFSLRWRVDFR